jgi:hypothetical protein
MTPESINAAIAEFCGQWRNYYHDLNAVHEAEAHGGKQSSKRCVAISTKSVTR